LWERVSEGGLRSHPGGPDRRNVLERLLAEVIEDEVESSCGILLHARRNTNGTGLGQTFETCRDIDAVAKDIAVLDNDVALVDADTELDAPLRR
jgi:hypothetical protein